MFESLILLIKANPKWTVTTVVAIVTTVVAIIALIVKILSWWDANKQRKQEIKDKQQEIKDKQDAADLESKLVVEKGYQAANDILRQRNTDISNKISEYASRGICITSGSVIVVCDDINVKAVNKYRDCILNAVTEANILRTCVGLSCISFDKEQLDLKCRRFKQETPYVPKHRF